MISSNGYTWCHNERYLSNNMIFKDGDVIDIEFDPNLLEVRFRLNAKELALEVDEDLLSEGNVCFGVNLSSVDDQV